MRAALTLAVLRSARPKFLTLSLLSVLLGIGAALATGAAVAPADGLIALLGALAAHASVNLLNEHHDFHSGLDAMTQRTPFSGGSGSLPEHPAAAPAVRAWGWLMLLTAAAVGLYFVRARGLGLLPLGLAGLLLVVAYTPIVTRMPWMCLLAPGLGFGPLMVAGTAFAVSGHYAATALAAALPPLFFVSALLLVNQLPDIDADRRAGRRHLPIVWGRRRSAMLFGALVAAGFAAIALAAPLLPRLSLLALLPLPLAGVLVRRVYRHADDVGALVPDLGRYVALLHLTLLLFAAGLWLG